MSWTLSMKYVLRSFTFDYSLGQFEDILPMLSASNLKRRGDMTAAYWDDPISVRDLSIHRDSVAQFVGV
jgi:hypothetical protein